MEGAPSTHLTISLRRSLNFAQSEVSSFQDEEARLPRQVLAFLQSSCALESFPKEPTQPLWTTVPLPTIH